MSLLSYKGLETSTNHSFSELKAQEGHSFQINSKVVTATISNKDTSFLKEPVTFTFSHLKEVRSKSITPLSHYDGLCECGSIKSYSYAALYFKIYADI